MQVNLLALPSNTPTEPTANSPECAEESFADGFFAQMDQIWNQNERPDDAIEEKPVEKDVAKTENDILRMMHVSLVADSSPLPVSQPNLPSDLPEQSLAFAVSFETSEQKTDSGRAIPAVPGNEQTLAPGRTVDPTSISKPVMKEAENLPCSTGLIESKDTAIETFKGTGESALSKHADSVVAQKTDRAAVNSSFASERVQRSVSGKLSDSSLPNGVEEPSPSPTDEVAVLWAVSERENGISRRPGENVFAPKTGIPNVLRIAADAFAATDSGTAVLHTKSEAIAGASLENVGKDTAHSDTGNSQNGFAPWLSHQAHAASVQKDSAGILPSIDKQQKDVQFQTAASPVRLGETGSSLISKNVESAAPQPREFIVEIADRMLVQLRDGKGEIRVQLQPDSLGHLEIRAESTLNGVVARIVAESSSIKNYLETNLHVLQQSLQDQGLKVDRIQVSVQDNGNLESFAGFTAQSGHTGLGQDGRGNGRSGVPGVSHSDQPEELTVDPLTWAALNPNIRFHRIA